MAAIDELIEQIADGAACPHTRGNGASEGAEQVRTRMNAVTTCQWWTA